MGFAAESWKTYKIAKDKYDVTGDKPFHDVAKEERRVFFDLMARLKAIPSQPKAGAEPDVGQGNDYTSLLGS